MATTPAPSWAGLVKCSRARSDEAADLFFGPREGLDALVAAGKVKPETVVDLVNSTAGFAVRKGAARPDVSTAEAIRRTILASRGIVFPNPGSSSPSANHLARVAEQLGIRNELLARRRATVQGLAAGASLLVKPDADLAFQQQSELLLADGIELLGPMPPELSLITTMSAGVMTRSREPAAAMDFIRYLQQPPAAAVMRRWKLEPIAPIGAGSGTKQ